MKTPQLPPFDPLSLPESNASQYPEPLLSLQRKRFNRRLGDRVVRGHLEDRHPDVDGGVLDVAIALRDLVR